MKTLVTRYDESCRQRVGEMQSMGVERKTSGKFYEGGH